jgi:hypothetical protein
MNKNAEATRLCTAFEGSRLIASGKLAHVAVKAKEVIDLGERGPVLIFDNQTSHLIEVDFRGNEQDVLERLNAATGQRAEETEPDQRESVGLRRPGRPKLGVVAREVTLLPRHWEWLNSQPGGASVALRKLVDGARRVNAGKDRVRQAQEAAYRFMSAMAGNEPGFEEATRSLFAGNAERFQEMIAEWPVDVRDHAKKLAAASFAGLAEIG